MGWHDRLIGVFQMADGEVGRGRWGRDIRLAWFPAVLAVGRPRRYPHRHAFKRVGLAAPRAINRPYSIKPKRVESA
jgi:hypothetical protein